MPLMAVSPGQRQLVLSRQPEFEFNQSSTMYPYVLVIELYSFDPYLDPQPARLKPVSPFMHTK